MINDEEIKAFLDLAGHIPEEKITADVLRKYTFIAKVAALRQAGLICMSEHDRVYDVNEHGFLSGYVLAEKIMEIAK